MGSLTIRLGTQLEGALDRLAKARHQTKSEVARELLRRHIAVRQMEETRNKLCPYAEAAGYLTDEDFFRDIS